MQLNVWFTCTHTNVCILNYNEWINEWINDWPPKVNERYLSIEHTWNLRKNGQCDQQSPLLRPTSS